MNGKYDSGAIIKVINPNKKGGNCNKRKTISITFPNGEVAEGEITNEQSDGTCSGTVTLPDDYDDEGKNYRFTYNPETGDFTLDLICKNTEAKHSSLHQHNTLNGGSEDEFEAKNRIIWKKHW